MVKIFDKKYSDEDIETEEIVALLYDQFLHSRHSPVDDKGNLLHIVYYGNDEIKVLYKSKNRQILSIDAGKNLDKIKKKEIISIIDDIIVQKSEEYDFGHGIIFSKQKWNSKLKICDDFAISPMSDKDPLPPDILTDYPLYLNFRFKKTGMRWLDTVRRNKAFNHSLLIISVLAPVFCNNYFFNPIGNQIRKSWVLVDSKDNLLGITSRWCQIGYWPLEQIVDQEFNHWPVLSPEIDTIMRKYQSLSLDVKETFILACYWFHRGIIDNSSTTSFLNFILMIEGLLPSDSKICNECKQPQYQISKRFRDFVVKYSGQDNHKLAKEFYTMRSQIVHNSSLIAKDDPVFSVGIVPIEEFQRNKLQELQHLCSLMILNWIMDQ
ncbi:HEPN domain-containing protein [Aphanizomenon sp. PH219]|nr:HEPN domain-containing protein [Aphanizomenon sp. 202]MDK2461703.1 HEPN domain-containing protein [Aphanizomenon sp. PH219]